MSYEYPPTIEFNAFPASPLAAAGEVAEGQDLPLDGSAGCPLMQEANADPVEEDKGVLSSLVMKTARKESVSFQDEEHDPVPSSEPTRFCFAPTAEDVTFQWDVERPDKITSGRLELFYRGSANPIWSQDLDSDGVAAGQLQWNGTLSTTENGTFPDSVLTAAQSPYKLKMVIDGEVDSARSVAWTYCDVLVHEILLRFGNTDEAGAALSDGTNAGVTVIPKERTEAGGASDIEDRWKDKVHELELGILTELAANPISDDQRVYLESNIFCTDLVEQPRKDEAYRLYKNMWGNGPFIPLFAQVKVRDSNGDGVTAPLALSGSKFLWDWEDRNADKVPLWTGREQQRTKDFLEKALDFLKEAESDAGYAPDGSDNCHRLHGGKRGEGAAPVFPEQSAADYDVDTADVIPEKFPFIVTDCDERKWGAISEPRTKGVLAGHTGAIFQPSRMAGDCYRVAVYLVGSDDFPFDLPGAELRDAGFVSPKSSSGLFEVSRRLNARIIRRSNTVDVPDIAGNGLAHIKEIYRGAGIDLVLPPADTMLTADWVAAIQRAKDSILLKSMPDPFSRVALENNQDGPYGLHIKDRATIENDLLAGRNSILSFQVAGGDNGLSTFLVKAGDILLNETKGIQTEVLGNVDNSVLIEDLGGLEFENTDVVRLQRDQTAGTDRTGNIAGLVPIADPDQIRAKLTKGLQKIEDNGQAGKFCKLIMQYAQKEYIDAQYPGDSGLFTFLYKDFNQRFIQQASGASNYTVTTETRALIYSNRNSDFVPGPNAPGIKSFDAVTAHEIGHALFIPHLTPNGGLDRVHIHLGDTPEERRDNDYCIMNYHPQSERFCGVCILSLRGWSIYGDQDRANNAEYLVPLKQKAPENAKVFRMISLTADIPATPPKTRRRMPGSTAYNIPERSEFTATMADTDIDANSPLVLLTGTVPVGGPLPGQPDLDEIAKPIKLKVEFEAPEGARVVWKIERAADDHADVIASSPSNTPTIVIGGENESEATLHTDAVGTFHICASINVDGRRNYPDDEAEFLCLNLVLVNIERIKSDHNFTGKHVACRVIPNAAAGGNADVTIVTRGNGDGRLPMRVKTKVKLIGGGADGQRGLEKIHGGWINNLTRDQTGARYDRANGGVWEVGMLYLHRTGPNAAWLPIFPPMSAAEPIIDSGGGGSMARWSLHDAPLSDHGGNPAPARSLADYGEAKTVGRECWIQNADAPGQGFDVEPPTQVGQGYRMNRIWMNLGFVAHLCFWSNGVGDMAKHAPALVGVIESVPWRVETDYRVTHNARTGAISTRSNVRRVVADPKTKYPALIDGVTAGVQVCPAGKVFMRARNIDGTLAGTNWETGNP